MASGTHPEPAIEDSIQILQVNKRDSLQGHPACIPVDEKPANAPLLADASHLQVRQDGVDPNLQLPPGQQQSSVSRDPPAAQQVQAKNTQTKTQDGHGAVCGTTADGDHNMSSGSSKAGSTQPFSQNFFEEHTSPSKTKKLHGDKKVRTDYFAKKGLMLEAITSERGATGMKIETGTGRTYKTDATGHVDLGTLSKPSSKQRVVAEEEQEDLDDDDLGAVTQVAIEASQFPEERRFRAPKTPASYRMNLSVNGLSAEPGSATDTTPRLAANPFASRLGVDPGFMSLSQVFNATQAPSSPMFNVPTSDGISERPSPEIWTVKRPNSAPESTPLKTSPLSPEVQPRHRLGTEPFANYITLTASQEEREKQIPSSPPSDPGVVDSDYSDDDFASASAKRREEVQRRREQIREESRRNFRTISADLPTPTLRGGIGSRRQGRAAYLRSTNAVPVQRETQALINSPQPKHPASDAVPRLRLIDSSQSHVPGIDDAERGKLPDDVETEDEQDVSDAETEFHDQNGPQQNYEDEKASDYISQGSNKENINTRSVQVPRTVSKRRQVIGNGEPVRPQVKRRRLTNPEREASGFGEVADSQTTHRLTDQSRHHHSPIQSGPVVPQSQVQNRAPVREAGPHPATEAEIALDPLRSQQTVTPPSSSPSPEKRDEANSPKAGPLRRKRGTAGNPVRHLIDQPLPSEDELVSPITVPQPSFCLQRHSRDPELASEPANTSEQGSSPPVPPGTVQETATASQRLQIPSQKRQLRRPRKFSEIAPPQSPSSQGLDLEINILSRDDQEFQSRLGTSTSRSPVRLPRRLTRRNEAANSARESQKLRRTSSASEFDQPEVRVQTTDRVELATSVPKSSEPQPVNGQCVTAVSRVSKRGRSSQNAKEILPNVIQSNHSPLSTKRKRPIIESTPDTHQATSQPPVHLLPSSSAAATDAVQVPQLERADSVRRAIPKVDSSHPVPREESEPSLSISGATAPHRVWALFKGTPAGYYPATCLGPADVNKFRVRFDDDTEDVIPMVAVRRLELRVGDFVKIDVDKTRGQMFVVQELIDKQDSQKLATTARISTDVNGYSKIRVNLKQRDGPLCREARMQGEQVVPVALVRLTTTMLSAWKNRTYTHQASDELASALPLTPIINLSTPNSPSSRQRRMKAVAKSQSSLRQSMKSNPSTRGLFTEMAFVITAVVKEKRSELESMITSQGGTLVNDGLESLLQVPDAGEMNDENGSTPFELTPGASLFGFTALLTEKHSRTRTYVQALALNIPCLSVRWLHDCIAKNSIVSWRHYLLASGESQVLQGAICSRFMHLDPHYADSDENMKSWPLHSMVDFRSRLMRGQNVLIMTSRGSGPSSPYQFFAHAMGAQHVALVKDWSEAAHFINAKEGTTWDWLCCPDKSGADGMSSEDASKRGRSRGGKKRKSEALDVYEHGSEALGVELWNGVKVVEQEFVVQSLFLDRLVAG